jgi:prophage tail gpP-like protein
MADIEVLPEVNVSASQPPSERPVSLYLQPNIEQIYEQAKRQPQSIAGVDSEIATIDVRGQRFDDWESVWVQHRWAESSALFRFTAAEREPVPELWQRVQFVPGDICSIYLGGILALNNGIITDRQVGYEAEQHGVQLLGRSLTFYAAQSSLNHETNNFDGKTFEQVARAILAPYSVGIKVIGNLNPRPYKVLRAPKGAPIWDFLETIARPRGIVLGSDHLGNFLLIGDHSNPVNGDLVEGDNILKCQCLISIQNLFAQYVADNQSGGGDDHNGTEASEQEESASGSAPTYAYNLFPSPFPVWDKSELKEEALNEAIWHEGTKVQATITTQGWLRPNTRDLWRAGDNVFVKSPMAMLNQVMKIQTATFTQDSNSGTLTTLDLVVPWLLRDKKYGELGTPDGLDEPTNNPSPEPGTVPAAPAHPDGNAPFVEGP